MNVQEVVGMLFALAVLVIIFGFPGRRRKNRRRDQEELDESLRQQNSELLDQLKRLEERIKVLERIVTDDPNDLRRQFRDLAG